MVDFEGEEEEEKKPEEASGKRITAYYYPLGLKKVPRSFQAIAKQQRR